MDLKQFIYDWNLKYRIDRIYRKKYGIRFNSKEHRELNLIDMKIELEEDYLFEKLKFENETRGRDREDYIINGSWLRERIEEMSEQDFNEIDVLNLGKSKE